MSNCHLASSSDWTIGVLRHDWNASCSARMKTACNEVINMVNEKRLAENYDNIKNLGLLTFASLFSVFRGKSCHIRATCSVMAVPGLVLQTFPGSLFPRPLPSAAHLCLSTLFSLSFLALFLDGIIHSAMRPFSSRCSQLWLVLRERFSCLLPFASFIRSDSAGMVTLPTPSCLR